MVKGIAVFKEYFADFTDQYVLIGGVASADYLVYQVNNVQQYDIYQKPPAVYQQEAAYQPPGLRR